MSLTNPPLILDFDHSLLPLAGDEIRLPLNEWQERIRFGCRHRELQRVAAQLKNLPAYGCVFTGSGDYHHLSALLLQRHKAKGQSLEVVVCDNHPDNMVYPFGIHCGSWVYHASKLPFVTHIHVIGITSADITVRHAWENRWGPLLRGKVSYWSIGKRAKWLDSIGAKKAHTAFASAAELVEAFTTRSRESERVYLSIDKDVFAPHVVQTNWDQGCFEFEHIQTVIAACRERLVGADITGEISAYRYRSLYKRILAGLDGLKQPAPEKLQKWQEAQATLNRRLLQELRG